MSALLNHILYLKDNCTLMCFVIISLSVINNVLVFNGKWECYLSNLVAIEAGDTGGHLDVTGGA